MPKISVVLPCFNVGRYIGRCLDSLLNQTLRDIEIICVDDKSGDNTAEVIKQYVAKDARVRLIEQKKNSGVSIARNTGVDAASGEYIGFVDPDDWVDRDYYQKLYDKIVAEDADVCAGNTKEHYTNGKIKVRNDIINNIIRAKCHFCYTVWCAIYKTSFIRENKIYCPVGITNGEDTVFCIQCALMANKVVGVKNAYYHYIRYENSAEGKYYHERHINSRIQVANMVVDMINKQENISPSDYVSYFNKVFRQVCWDVFERTTRRDLLMRSLTAAFEIYKRNKHKSYIDKTYIAPYLRCDDIEGLYEIQKKMYTRPSKVFIKLFNKIHIIRIRYYADGVKYSVLGIPLIYIKHANQGIYHIQQKDKN